MTEFQQKCIASCREFFKKKLGFEASFVEVKGEKESYFVAKTPQLGEDFELYVYVDEAGFGKPSKPPTSFWKRFFPKSDWTICERPDFDSDEELIAGLLTKLEARLKPAGAG